MTYFVYLNKVQITIIIGEKLLFFLVQSIYHFLYNHHLGFGIPWSCILCGVDITKETFPNSLFNRQLVEFESGNAVIFSRFRFSSELGKLEFTRVRHGSATIACQ